MRVWRGFLLGWGAIGMLAAAASAQPVADAGDDVTVECAGTKGTAVTLDGTGSSMGPTIEYLWKSPGVDFDDETSVTPTGRFRPGESSVLLEVTDTETELSDQDEVLVTVEDTDPPVAGARAFPSVLWPPNNKLVEVKVRLRIRDCDPEPRVVLADARSNEPENDPEDIQEADIGTDDRHVLLRASRSGEGKGRVYRLTYRIADAAGNETDAVARVLVPHDKRDDDSDTDSDSDSHSDSDSDSDSDSSSDSDSDSSSDSDTDTDEDSESDSDSDSDLPHIPDPEICKPADEALEEWLYMLPDPSEFSDARACAYACRSWYAGCRNDVRSAATCRDKGAQSVARLAGAWCRDLDDREKQRACAGAVKLKAGEKRAEDKVEGYAAGYACREEAAECAARCREEFGR